MRKPGLEIRRGKTGEIEHLLVNPNVHEKYKNSPSFRKMVNLAENAGILVKIKPRKTPRDKKITKEEIGEMNNGIRQMRHQRRQNKLQKEALNMLDPIPNTDDESVICE